MKQPSIFLFAGEASGDLLGEKLVAALKTAFPMTRIYGVGGPKMLSKGFECILPMEKFEVMGFVDVFFALPRLFKHFFFLKKRILKENPDIVLFIDYPGFNLALAKSLFKNSFNGYLFHFVCPSVWAWGKKRIYKMEKILDRLFVTFPFEKNLFDPKKLAVEYVGHPLIEKISSETSSPLDIAQGRRVIALFPGSRHKEIWRNYPTQLKVAKRLLNGDPDLIFAVSVAKESFLIDLKKITGDFPEQNILFVSSSENSNLMKRADFAIAKSGTNNLELALHHVPTVVTYGISPIDLFIAKNILRIQLPYYCIVNILANQEVFPELIGPNFTAEALYNKIKIFLNSEDAIKECREKCIIVGNILGNHKPELKIVESIKQCIKI